MKKILLFLKREPMLIAAVSAAVIAMIITPPSADLLLKIDWRTLGTLFMMLTVLEGFKKENIFNPLLAFAGKINSMVGLSLFLVFSVFFSSMFVTNDVSLIIFVPLTIILFRTAQKEKYILPVITLENIAAVRGSMLTPFGSPQNLFIYGQSNVSAVKFVLYMMPIWAISGVLLAIFVISVYHRDLKEKALTSNGGFMEKQDKNRRPQRIAYLCIFAVVVFTIVSRTQFWGYICAAVFALVLIIDKKILIKTDYVLLVTFLCFFIFSSSIAANEKISAFLSGAVSGNEYAWSILLSQVISNVPAAIVLYPFAQNRGALLYGLDSAGLCTIIGSLASVINYRIYVREYPKNGLKFIAVFTVINLIFFALVVIPGYLISKTPM